MNNLSRGTWLAIAAVAAIPATVAIAKTIDRGGWHNMTPETRSRLEEGRIAMVKAALEKVEGIAQVAVNMTFDPPWTPERMSEEAKLELNMF